MTNSWEKVLNTLTVIALLICLLQGVQQCVGSYQDYVEWLSVSDEASLPYRQAFFEARFHRQALFQSMETLGWMSLCILVSRFFYLFLKHRVPVWEAEAAHQNDPSDEVSVLVRIVHENAEPSD